MDNFVIDPILLNALHEDIGGGDITTDSCVPANQTISGRFIAKADGVLCGLSVAARVFALLDDSLVFSAAKQDGDTVQTGELIATVSGNARAILKGERTALNLLQHMSGIASMAAEAAAKVPHSCRVVDTRKTTPGLRVLDKYAVRVGGGHNHRFNLADGVLIKDNHIAAAGGIARAVAQARANVPHTTKIEVETSTLDEVKQALAAKSDIIMLDNMTNEQMREAVRLIDGQALTEASGNMGDKDLTLVAATGVDIISVGALTHSVRALDISLKLEMDTCSV